MNIILATTSPYKKALFEQLKLPFAQADPQVDESIYKGIGLEPQQLAEKLALLKAKALKESHPNSLIIGADQLVNFNGQTLGKPGSKAKACEQLLSMCGKTHELITSVALITPKKEYLHTVTTELKMKDWSAEQISNYVDLDEPIDCAGAYKLEKSGIALFESITTEDHSAIVGLPLLFISNVLFDLGFDFFKPQT